MVVRWVMGLFRTRRVKDLVLRKCFVTIFMLLSCASCVSMVGYWVYTDPSAANAWIFSSISLSENFGEKLRHWKTAVLEANVHEANSLARRNGSYLTYTGDLFLSESGTWEPISPPIQLNSSDLCPETRLPDLEGRLEVNMSEITMSQVESRMFQTSENGYAVHQMVSLANKRLQSSMVLNNYADAVYGFGLSLDIDSYTYLPGGHWVPKDCKPKWKVGIIVPFRDRYEHLPILLRHVVPMLQRQRLEFAFFVIEQANQESFNRAMLFNVGFLESLKFHYWDCFLFHDVDHIPENDRNYYGCGTMPRHFVRGLDKYGYRLPYFEFFGGVSGLTREQMSKINGFPNSFWGWGGEDDDLWNRVSFAGYEVSRPVGSIGYYKSIQHHHKGTPQNLARFSLLWKSKERNRYDGLSNCMYGHATISVHSLYFNISVDIRKVDIIMDS